MSDTAQHGNNGHGSYEHQDMTPKSVIYFLLILGVATIFSVFLLRGVYVFLDRHEKATQEPVNPLLTKVPEDTRHVRRGYPQTAFPEPRLEDDERNQLDGIMTEEQDRLYTYGWIDRKAGTLHIPIDRAMDLLVQRGLPVRPQNGSAMNEGSTTDKASTNSAAEGATPAAKRR